MAMRFGLYDGNPHTLDEIGKALGLTRERIRQLEKQSLSKLRHPSRAQPLLDYASLIMALVSPPDYDAGPDLPPGPAFGCLGPLSRDEILKSHGGGWSSRRPAEFLHRPAGQYVTLVGYE